MICVSLHYSILYIYRKYIIDLCHSSPLLSGFRKGDSEMKKKLTFDDTERLLAQLRVSRPRDDCWSCDCLQGFLNQIELDAGEDIADLGYIPTKVRKLSQVFS